MPAHKISILLALALVACDHSPSPAAPAPQETARVEEAGVADGTEARTGAPERFAVTPIALATTTRAALHVAPRDPAALEPVTLRRAVVARDVVDHEPVGAAETFAADDTAKLFVFLDVRNDATTPAELTVSFVRTDLADARERGGVTLTVPASARRFRTWAYTRQVHAPGEWSAIVRDTDGHVVTRLPFVVSGE